MFVYQRWESDTRYYEIRITQGLFGDPVLVKNWGGKFNRLGGMQTLVIGKEMIHIFLKDIKQERIRKGYECVTTKIKHSWKKIDLSKRAILNDLSASNTFVSARF